MSEMSWREWNSIIWMMFAVFDFFSFVVLEYGAKDHARATRFLAWCGVATAMSMNPW
jgi:hypothetical protein